MATEENTNQTSDSSDEGSAGPVGGERLAESRRARGVSVHEIAKELHLDELKVRALEENRFDVLGAPVFAKGHMRKYAELVGVPIDDILADYYQLNRSVGAPPVVGPPRKVPRDLSIGPWVAGIVVIFMAAAAAWWWFSLEPTAERVTLQPATLAPFDSDGRVDPDAVADDSTPPTNAEATVEIAEEPSDSSLEEQQAVSVVGPAPEPRPDAVVEEQTEADGNAVAGSSVELVLSYTGDCWTEVTDAAGRRLYFGLGSDGRTVTLNGVEPLGVLLGNSSNVSVRVNGLDYTIPAANRRGNTARLTIYGQ